MKKFIAVILAALMVITMLPMTVFAESGSIGDVGVASKSDKTVDEYKSMELEDVVDFELEGFNGDVSVAQYTNGYYETNNDDEEYFYYWIPSVYQYDVTVTLKYSNKEEVVYHIEEVEQYDPDIDESWFNLDFFDENGNQADLDIFSYSNQQEEPWELGTHSYYIECAGITKEYQFTVTPAPERVEFVFADPSVTEFSENINGYYDDEYEAFIYNLPSLFDEGNQIIFYYSDEYDMAPVVYTCTFIEDPDDTDFVYPEFTDEDGNMLDEWIGYEDDFYQEENPLQLGDNYIPVQIGESFYTEILITIVPGPSEISFKPAKSIEIYENTFGWYDVDENEEEYFNYYLEVYILNEEGNILTVNYNDDRGEAVYISEIRDIDDWNECVYVNVDDPDDIIFAYDIGTLDDQYEEHWGLGTHELTLVYGTCETTIDVEIVESPVESISFEHIDGTPIIPVGEHLTTRWIDEYNSFEAYDLAWILIQEGNVLTVNYKDGTSVVYTCKIIDDEEGLWFYDADGNELIFEYFDAYDDQDTVAWSEGEHTVIFSYLGAEDVINVIIGREILTGWQEIEGKTYYYVDGNPVKGMQEIDGEKYIFALADGQLLYGKVRLAGKWYYMDDKTGVMTYGWKEFDGKLHYFGADGAMVTGLQTIEGTKYIFSISDGSMLTGKVRCAGKWYIMNKSTGAMLYGKVRCDGKWYIMHKVTGEMLYGKISCDGKMYIMSKTTGEMLYGKVTCDGKTYICSKSDGHIFTNQTVRCDGKTYTCDKYGVAR